MALRAIRARAPVASKRPPAAEKIHAGKKEPKMLYSGAWEQPTNTSGAVRDKPARGRNEVIRRRSRSVDSMFIFQLTPYTSQIGLSMSTSLPVGPERTSFPTGNPNPRITSPSIRECNEATSNRPYQSYVWIKPQS